MESMKKPKELKSDNQILSKRARPRYIDEDLDDYDVE